MKKLTIILSLLQFAEANAMEIPLEFTEEKHLNSCTEDLEESCVIIFEPSYELMNDKSLIIKKNLVEKISILSEQDIYVGSKN